MSTIDLSDPHIIMAYDAVAHNDPLRWFLMEFGKKPNVLQIIASGTGDIDELRSHIDPEHISYGLFREPTQDKFLRLSINYIPDSLKGVHRAKALVHGKYISNKFTANELLTVSKPEDVTVQALRSSLRLPPRVSQINNSASLSIPVAPQPTAIQALSPQSIPSQSPMPHVASPSQPTSNPNLSVLPSSPSPPRQLSRGVHRKPIPDMEPPSSDILIAQAFMESSDASEDEAGASSAPAPGNAISVSQSTPIPPPPKNVHSNTVPTISPLSPDVHSPISPISERPAPSWLAKQSVPLPPPPSEEPDDSDPQGSPRKSESSWTRPASPDIESIPDSTSAEFSPPREASPLKATTPDESAQRTYSQKAPSVDSDRMEQSTKMDPPSQVLPLVPEAVNSDRGSFDSTASDQKPGSSFNSSPPAIRTGSIFKSHILTPAEEEEERKIAILDEERKWRQAERVQREREEREKDEQRQREFEERKEKEKMRRLESARKGELQRAEIRRQEEEEEAKRKAMKQRREEETLRRRKTIGEQLSRNSGAGMELMSGFITMEYKSQWKRRYYRLCTDQWEFYKNDEEVTSPMQAVDLSRVTALKEWHEGYEELEAIPHSFTVELQDDAPYLFFADSSEDKEIILGLLNQAAGL